MAAPNPSSNNPPTVENAVVDQEFEEGFGAATLDLTNVFSDLDGDELTLSVVSDNTSVVTVNISSNTLTVNEVGNGAATITITANDGNGGTVDDEFTVTVNEAPNNPPIVINLIEDQAFKEGFASSTIDLSNVFSDADGDVLTLTATSDNTAVVTVDISSNTLTITEVGLGNANVTITANDGNGGTVDNVFGVVVSEPANNSPVVANAIEDQEFEEGFASATIDVSDVFSDSDGDVLSFTASSDDTGVVAVSVTDNTLTISEVGIGTANILVAADDGNDGFASDLFQVTITEASNIAPTVANAIVDQTFEAGFGSTTIDIADVFSDEDGDDLSYSVSSSDTDIATLSIAETTLTLTEITSGSADITVVADDGNGGSVSDSFQITIEDALGLGNVGVKFYPNPVISRLNIEGSRVSNIQLFDLEGREITVRHDEFSNSFNISELAEGLYVLRYNIKEKSYTQLIIKRSN